MTTLDDEPTQPHEPPIAIAWRAHERRQRLFFIGASVTWVALFLLLVVAGTMLKTLIANAPVVRTAATSCATVCCRPFNERQVTK